MDVIIIGYVGIEAKQTEKGYTFPVSTKFYQNGKEQTQWVSCFLNYQSKVVEYLKPGTYVHILGEIIVGVYQSGPEEYVPSITCIVRKVTLLNGKK